MMTTLNLKKNEVLNLKKSDSCKKLTIGLSWEPRCDLDTIGIVLDKNENAIEKIYFGDQGSITDYGIVLDGDDLQGNKAIDCETMRLDLDVLSKNKFKFIDIYCNIFFRL